MVFRILGTEERVLIVARVLAKRRLTLSFDCYCAARSSGNWERGTHRYGGGGRPGFRSTFSCRCDSFQYPSVKHSMLVGFLCLTDTVCRVSELSSGASLFGPLRLNYGYPFPRYLGRP